MVFKLIYSRNRIYLIQKSCSTERPQGARKSKKANNIIPDKILSNTFSSHSATPPAHIKKKRYPQISTHYSVFISLLIINTELFKERSEFQLISNGT